MTQGALIGRRGEVRMLRAAMRRASVGEPSVVLLEAETGFGKTRVLDAAAHDAHRYGLTVHQLRFGGRGATPAIAVGRPDEVVDRARQVPTLITVDDAAEAAAAELAWLEELVVALETAAPDVAPVVVVAARRTGPLADADRTVTTTDPLAPLARHTIVSRHRLRPIDRSGIVALLRTAPSLVAVADRAETIAPIAERATDGNPGLLVSLDTGGSDPHVSHPPTTVNDLSLALRVGASECAAADVLLARLAPVTTEVVSTIAAFGEPCPLDLVAAVHNLDHDTTLDALADGEDQGVLRFATGRADIAHPVIRHRVLTSTGRARLHRIERQIVDALRDRLEATGDATLRSMLARRLARLDPSDTEADTDTVALLLAAADHAFEQQLWDEAVLLYDAVDGRDRTGPAAEVARVALRAGESARAVGDDHVAMERLTEAARAFRAIGDDAGEITALIELSATAQRITERRDDYDRDRLITLVDTVGTTHPDLSAQAADQLAFNALMQQRHDEAAEWARLAAKHDGANSLQSDSALGQLAFFSVRPGEAADRLDAAASAIEPTTKPAARFGALYHRPLAHLMAGHLDRAHTAARELAASTADDNGLDLSYAAQAAVALLRGDLDGAETAADEGAGHVRRSGRYRHGIFVYPALLSTLALQGRRIDVFDALAEWRSQLPPNEAATSPPLLAAETAALLDLGELSTAAAAFGSIDLRLDRLALTVPYLAAVSIEAAWRLGGDRDVGREAAVIDQAVDQGGRVTSTGAIDLHLAAGTAQALAGDHLTALATIDRGVDDARRAGALTSLTRLLVRRLAVSDAAGLERDLALDAECEQLVERLALPGLARRLAALGRSRSLPPAVGGRVESHVWFTDLVDSTGHARRMGDRAFTDLATRLERALVGVAGRRGGDILSGITLGDGAVALFADGAEAVRAGFDAVEAARRLGVEIYVGIDTGPVVIERHRAYGTTVNTAARFCDAAEPGEVAVSTRVAETLDGDPTIEFVHRGTTPMKGIDGDQAVFTARHTTTEGNDDDHRQPAN